jgi:hypothetical protein
MGELHAAFLNADSSENPYYLRTFAGIWQSPELVNPERQGSVTAIAHRSGVTHLIFSDGGLRYARRSDADGWSAIESVSLAADEFSYNSIIAETHGVQIAYREGTHLEYAVRKLLGGYDRIPVDAVGDVGLHPSMAADSAGGVHITYSDEGNLRLRYAYLPPGSSTFFPETADTGGVGKFSAVGVDSNGGVHVAYVDQSNKDVKYAFRCPNR